MDINELIAIVKKKLTDHIDIENIEIEDKSFLHKNHVGNQEGRYHLKIILRENTRNHSMNWPMNFYMNLWG